MLFRSLEHCLPAAGGESVDVRAIAQDEAGDIWVVGAGRGLWRGRPGSFTPFALAGLGSRDAVRCLLGTPDGSLWVGTARKGLFRVRVGKVQRYGPDHGFPDMEVAAMVADRSGNLWFGAESQLVRARMADFDAVDAGKLPSIPCAGFGPSDGVPGPIRGGRQPSACVDAQIGRAHV